MTEQETSALKEALSSGIFPKTESIDSRQKHRGACLAMAIQVLDKNPGFDDGDLFSLADKIDEWIMRPYSVSQPKPQSDPEDLLP